MSLLRITK